MALLRINATPQGLRLHHSQRPPWPSISRAADGEGPVVIMIHGFRFAPGAGIDCPHQHILSATEEPRHRTALSWPRALGFEQSGQAPGLGIAFGWNALGSLWNAFKEAANVGQQLASLINQLNLRAPHRPIHLIGHSMGARVILSALPHASAASVTRILLLAPAEYRDTAARALNTPAGRTAEVFNITSRENDLYDFLLETLIQVDQPDRIMGSTPPKAPNLLSIQLDDPETLSALARRGLRLAPAQRRICHWSAYLRPGVFDLYRALLFDAHRHPLGMLRAALPQEMQPRWSRFRPVLPAKPTLPLRPIAPS
ncbi:MAG: DUF726 domain-containing protein [Thalassovita sp.]